VFHVSIWGLGALFRGLSPQSPPWRRDCTYGYIYRQGSLSMCRSRCQKQKTHCLRLHFQDFAIANLFMIPVVAISHGSLCSMFFRIRLFSLFYLTGLLCSSIISSLETDLFPLQLVAMRYKEGRKSLPTFVNDI